MGALNSPLYICGGGAVTPAGLTARQSCAAIRAAVSAFGEFVSDPVSPPQTVARVPAHWKLRQTKGDWLVNMAARAIDEAMETGGLPPEATVILLTAPESFRGHPAWDDIPPGDFLSAILNKTGKNFHMASRSVDGGAAASIGLLDRVAELLAQPGIQQVLLGGVDSLVNGTDIARLAKAGRLKNHENSQGLVPGEAAVFVRLTLVPEAGRPTHAAVYGTGVASEKNSALTEKYSQGSAILAAMREAVSGSGPSEPDIHFVVSNANGERYAGWEETIARPRFYRTHRKILPAAYTAMTLGEVGAASGALALLLAADSIEKGYAPGPVAMCEVASEGGLRAAAVVAEARRS